MKTLLSALVIGLAAFTAADHADAAPLNYFKNEPVIDFFTTVDYIEDAGFADLFSDPVDASVLGTPQTGDVIVYFILGFDPLSPSSTAFGGLFAVDDDGGFLDGDVLATGFVDDVLQVLFGNLSGSAAGDFGRFALLELVFVFPEAGTNPLTTLIDGTSYEVFGTVYSATPIPVPAALPLLAGALGGLVLLRRRR